MQLYLLFWLCLYKWLLVKIVVCEGGLFALIALMRKPGINQNIACISLLNTPIVRKNDETR